MLAITAGAAVWMRARGQRQARGVPQQGWVGPDSSGLATRSFGGNDRPRAIVIRAHLLGRIVIGLSPERYQAPEHLEQGAHLGGEALYFRGRNTKCKRGPKLDAGCVCYFTRRSALPAR